ncbi:acyl-CoA dehydrogenase [Mangrovimicrobium sediminis]|uniref:Acyl-CoA dehydrogenase n=1 Tax=Mangrovimicrobium sediminis TaxID=2562682 RepID=A0A4Z0LVJ8_9GAMM|nr:acyl-CoA dehydrogenase [Haliea sp. SAOS-164]TGD71299.1 acyl-CoA dehydrogenase [Haliea sp. SAOS-164]
MYLALDADEREIADAAADFLANEFPLQRLHASARDPERLAAFAELGWLGLAAPEAAGGSALGVVEEMLFFAALGYQCGPLAVFTQVLAAAAAQENIELCAGLCAGQVGSALLVTPPNGDAPVRLVGDAAAPYAVAVDAAGATLYALQGEYLHEQPCLDQSVGMYTGPAQCLQLVQHSAGEGAWRRAQVAVSAMSMGIAERALAMIVEYARERETFGRKIGAYQAVRHPCADMAVRNEAARSQLYYAATALHEGHADAAMQVDAAQLLAARAARMNTDANIQLHGGIGVTDEHDAHLLLKRANLLERLLGAGRSLRASLLAPEAGEEAH